MESYPAGQEQAMFRSWRWLAEGGEGGGGWEDEGGEHLWEGMFKYGHFAKTVESWREEEEDEVVTVRTREQAALQWFGDLLECDISSLLKCSQSDQIISCRILKYDFNNDSDCSGTWSKHVSLLMFISTLSVINYFVPTPCC